MVDPIKFVIPVPQDAEDYARADTQRNRRLFAWADGVLKQLGLDRDVAAARSLEQLRRITLDLDSAEIALAIRDALHPASGQREEIFRGLQANGLRIILKNRFAEMKKDRETVLRRGKQPSWTDGLILDGFGLIVPNLANLILILKEHPAWKGVLGYDEFGARAVIRKRPPWGPEAPDTAWSDFHDAQTRVWFQTGEINASNGDVGRAVQTAARHNPFHPVRDYLDALGWDGVLRLDTWLIDYFHAEATPYIRAIGPRYLISAVARMYRPGCKVDHTIVLEGPQGKQKSEALRTLAVNEAWFADRLSHVSSKDAAQETAGTWIIEIAEMHALTTASTSAAKSFLTRRTDRFRPPYGKHVIARPRQCVFAGTINPMGEGYLQDHTGARRIWPVACGGTINLAGLEATRDQLWAEAVRRFRAGATWWLETPELEALATVEQEARFISDEWETPIREWLGDCTDVSIAEVLTQVFGIPKSQHSQTTQNRVARILTHRLGFKKYRPRTPGAPAEHIVEIANGNP